MIECCEGAVKPWRREGCFWGAASEPGRGLGHLAQTLLPCGRLPRWGNLGKQLLRNKDFGGISGDPMNFRVRSEDPFKIFCFGPYFIRRET